MTQVQRLVQNAHMPLRLVTTLLMVLLIAGCAATPNLGDWARNSAELANAVALEHQQVLQNLDRSIAEIQIGENEGWQLAGNTSDIWRKHRDSYFASAVEIDVVLTGMVRYSNALSNLAASGETGKASVAKMNKSVNEIAEVLRTSNPISSGALAVIEAFADAWTRVQAQDSLAAAMQATDADVGKLADFIQDIAAAQNDVVASLHALQRRLIRQSAGPNRMAWYVKNHGYRQMEDAFGDDFNVETAAAITYLIESLEPRFRAREQHVMESMQWLGEREQALLAINAASTHWRQSHLDAAEYLRDCGGMRSLRRGCGTYSTANLKLAADRIRTLVAAVSPSPDEPVEGEPQ